MNRSVHLALALALALILTAGTWALVRHQQSQPASAEESAEIDEQRELNTQLLQDTLNDELMTQPMGERQERMDSPTGQALFRSCLEWTEFNENHPSESALANKENACGEYRTYVDDGVLPD